MENKKEFTREMVQDLRNEINKALAPLGAMYGMDFIAGNATYQPLSATFKLEVSFAKSEDFDPEKATWDNHCRYSGLKPEDFGKMVVFNGTTYRICGYEPKARKNCVKIRQLSNGKIFVASSEEIRRALTAKQDSDKQTASDGNTDAAGPSIMDQKLWNAYTYGTGLLPEDLGAEVKIKNRVFTIVGFNPRATKDKIELNLLGKPYKASIDTVLMALGREKVV